MLVEYFIQRYASKAGKTIRSIDRKTLDALQTYDWPGNIRELQNVIERSVILTFGDVFAVDPLWLSNETSRPAPPKASRTERENNERELAETRGRVSGPSGAAAKLRIPPSTLTSRIKVLKINRSQFNVPRLTKFAKLAILAKSASPLGVAVWSGCSCVFNNSKRLDDCTSFPFA